MENSSHALHIAFGVLIAIVIIGLILMVYRNIVTLEKTDDTIAQTQNQKEFNDEFTVFDKNLMYGTDVLSCLNKAQSNNQKYVYNNYYGKDTSEIPASSRAEYLINVTVKLNTTVQEKITVSYRDKTGKSVLITGKPDTFWNASNFFECKMFKQNNNPHFKLPTVTYYYFGTGASEGKLIKEAPKDYDAILWNTNTKLSRTIGLKAGTFDTTMVGNKTYELVSESDDASKLSALLSTVTNVEQTIKNPVEPTLHNDTDWYSATWRSATYDFKTRKFKCTGIEYNEQTGHVNKIMFEER